MIKFAILWPMNENDSEHWEIERQDKVELAYLQGVVGGNIEAITLSDGSIMYVNEDGKGMGLRYNHAASVLAHEAGIAGWDQVVGPAVVLGPGDAAGNETSITEAMLERLGKAT